MFFFLLQKKKKRHVQMAQIMIYDKIQLQPKPYTFILKVESIYLVVKSLLLWCQRVIKIDRVILFLGMGFRRDDSCLLGLRFKFLWSLLDFNGL